MPTASQDDLVFQQRFDRGDVAPTEFDHRNHLRLAYVFLCESSVRVAKRRMRDSLRTFLTANDIDPSKYHETLTCSWVEAVKHFMQRTPNAPSFDAFIAADDRLLEHRIMLTHYRKETLFSQDARYMFIAPDLEPIPQYA